MIIFTLRKKNTDEEEELDRWPPRETPLPTKTVVREGVSVVPVHGSMAGEGVVGVRG